MEDLSFDASERCGERVVLTAETVQSSAGALATKADLSRFML